MELAYLHSDHLECDQDVVGGQIPAPDLGEGHGPCGGGSTAPKFGGFNLFLILTFKKREVVGLVSLDFANQCVQVFEKGKCSP